MYSFKVLERLVPKSRTPMQILQKASISLRTFEKPRYKEEEGSKYPRKIFSGIQPSGQLHLGNYLGAIRKWVDLQNNREDVTFCIVDMHSITTEKNPVVLRENIFEMAATMYACGIKPEDNNLFVQSSIKEHSELCWILSCLCTMARLGHLPQFKEKSRTLKDVPLGLFVYPVLQAADILVHKATHIPVGEDQLQHIQLAQHLARTFNSRFGDTFPVCHASIENQEAARIRSLRNPSKKMSKSDTDAKGIIYIRDEPDTIVEKVKKAVTDFTSDVTYDLHNRAGVSNLVAIHSLIVGKPIDKIIGEAKTLDTSQYKLRVAEALVEHLKPIKIKIDRYLAKKSELIYLLEQGADKKRQHVQETLEDVKQKMGLGNYASIPQLVDQNVITEKVEEKPVKEVKVEKKFDDDGKPIVPKQKIRVESRRSSQGKSSSPFQTGLNPVPKLANSKDMGASSMNIGNSTSKLQSQLEQNSNQGYESSENAIN